MRIKYFEELSGFFPKIEASGRGGGKIELAPAFSTVIKELSRLKAQGNKAIIIGNGGSASIASHMVTDFVRNAGIPAVCFNDPALLTCIGNDFGYEYVFEKPIQSFCAKGDVLFSVSSSGKSENILNASKAASRKGCFLVTCSGFRKDNPLRRAGDINFYVPSISYGYVEIIHLAICHYIVDYLKDNG